MEEKRDLMVGLRLNEVELSALKTLAARETQTLTGWLRRRLYAEATAAGLIDRPFERARSEVIHAEDRE